MIPLVKKGFVKRAYFNWISESSNSLKRKGTAVLPLEFLGWHYKYPKIQKSGKPPVWSWEGKQFIGEKWLCKDLETGIEKEYIFRHEIFDADNSKETSLKQWSFSNIILDDKPNLLIDSLTEWLSNSISRKKYPNPRLLRQQEKLDNRIRKLKEMLEEKNISAISRKGIFLYLRHKESPTIETFNSLIQWRTNYPQQYQEMLEKVYLSTHGVMT
jgi:hypothetical protein